MSLVDKIAKSGECRALQENIAAAIFNHHYNRVPGGLRDWEWAKHHDQWLAISSWDTAGAVLEILPIKMEVQCWPGPPDHLVV